MIEDLTRIRDKSVNMPVTEAEISEAIGRWMGSRQDDTTDAMKNLGEGIERASRYAEELGLTGDWNIKDGSVTYGRHGLGAIRSATNAKRTTGAKVNCPVLCIVDAVLKYRKAEGVSMSDDGYIEVGEKMMPITSIPKQADYVNASMGHGVHIFDFREEGLILSELQRPFHPIAPPPKRRGKEANEFATRMTQKVMGFKSSKAWEVKSDISKQAVVMIPEDATDADLLGKALERVRIDRRRTMLSDGERVAMLAMALPYRVQMSASEILQFLSRAPKEKRGRWERANVKRVDDAMRLVRSLCVKDAIHGFSLNLFYVDCVGTTDNDEPIWAVGRGGWCQKIYHQKKHEKPDPSAFRYSGGLFWQMDADQRNGLGLRFLGAAERIVSSSGALVGSKSGGLIPPLLHIDNRHYWISFPMQEWASIVGVRWEGQKTRMEMRRAVDFAVKYTDGTHPDTSPTTIKFRPAGGRIEFRASDAFMLLHTKPVKKREMLRRVPLPEFIRRLGKNEWKFQ